MLRIGLLSDTHGLLRPEVRAFLDGCVHIVHAGDVCDPGILRSLAAIAPVTAVRGNNDRGAWADGLRATATHRVRPLGASRRCAVAHSHVVSGAHRRAHAADRRAASEDHPLRSR